MSMLLRKEQQARIVAKRTADRDGAEKPMPHAMRGSPESKRPIEPLPSASTSTLREGPAVPHQSTLPLNACDPIFSINFVRDQTLPLRVRRALAYLGLGYLVVNLVIFVTFIGMAIQSHQQARALQRQLHTQRPSAAAVSAIRQEMGTLQKRAVQHLTKLNTMIALQKQRFPVAGKLAALTKTLPGRTWITSLSGQRDTRTMTIQAAYLMNPDAPYDLPTKQWIEALRADPVFRQGLKRLELGSSSRKTQGSAELFVFELVAEWNAPTTR